MLCHNLWSGVRVRAAIGGGDFRVRDFRIRDEVRRRKAVMMLMNLSPSLLETGPDQQVGK